MKFTRLTLSAYGRFTDHSLHFPADGAGFCLVTGLNEAGKSTILQALSDLLFGFARSSSYAFLHDLPALTLGASVQNQAGLELEFVRHKRNKNPLLDGRGQPLDESRLQTFLGGANRALFEELFGLSHERLRMGGEAILQGRGEVGSALFEAGSGVRGAQQIMDELGKEYEALYLSRGHKPRLNQLKAEWEAAKRRGQEALLSAEAWGELEGRQQELQQRMDEVGQLLGACQRELSRLERIRRVKMPLARRQESWARLQELGELPVIRSGSTERRRTGQKALQQAQEEAIRFGAEATRLEAEAGGVVVNPVLLLRGGEIEWRYKECGQFRKSLLDWPRREVELQEVESRLEVLRQEAGLGMGCALPAPGLLAEVRGLIGRKREIDLGLKQAREGVDLLESEQTTCDQALRDTREPPDFHALVRLLEEVRESGVGEERLRESLAELAALEEEVERGLRALPLWSGDVERLRAVATPSVEQVERVVEEWAEINREWRAIQQKVEDEQRGLAEVERAVSALQADGEIPTPEMVALARERRDWGWSLVRRFHLEGEQALQGEVEAFAGAYALADAFVRSMQRADELADQRLAQMERIARYQGLQVDLARCRERVAQAVAREQAVLARREACQAGWRRMWAGLGGGVEPVDPAGMRDWPRLRGEVLERLAALEKARKRLVIMQQERAGWCQRLQAVLADAVDVSGERSLSAWLRLGGEVVDRWQGLSQRRRVLEERLQALQQKLDEARRRVVRVEAEGVEWQALWHRCMADVGWSGEASLVQVDAALGLMEEMRRLSDRQAGLGQRIREMRKDYQRFEQQVTNLAEGLEVEGASPIERVEWLHRQWLDAAEAERLRKRLQQEVMALREREAGAKRVEEENRNRLAVLCSEYGVDNALLLEDVEQKVERQQALRAEIGRLESEIVATGEGHSLAGLMAEAEAEEGDSISGRVEALMVERDRLVNQRSELAMQLGEVRTGLGQMEGGDAAARAALDEEFALAQLERGAKQYVVSRLAAHLIGQAVVRFRERHQDPALRRASGLFAELTLGSFAGLETDFDDKGVPILLAMRPDGKPLKVAGLSDGSRDQLYLALHLAMLEQRLALSEPLPLILDDLLIHFDDQRAAAAFRVLAQVSRKTQVLFFTHHAHLVEVARQSLAEGEMRVLEL